MFHVGDEMPHHRDVTKLETVEFAVEIDGVRTRCMITINALKTQFGATESNAGRVLLENLDRISAVAVEVARRAGSKDRIVLRSADFSSTPEHG